jgi:hypothetical protein
MTENLLTTAILRGGSSAGILDIVMKSGTGRLSAPRKFIASERQRSEIYQESNRMSFQAYGLPKLQVEEESRRPKKGRVQRAFKYPRSSGKPVARRFAAPAREKI